MEDDIQPRLERLHVTNIHDDVVRVLEQAVTVTWNVNVTRDLVLKDFICRNESTLSKLQWN